MHELQINITAESDFITVTVPGCLGQKIWRNRARSQTPLLLLYCRRLLPFFARHLRSDLVKSALGCSQTGGQALSGSDSGCFQLLPVSLTDTSATSPPCFEYSCNEIRVRPPADTGLLSPRVFCQRTRHVQTSLLPTGFPSTSGHPEPSSHWRLCLGTIHAHR